MYNDELVEKILSLFVERNLTYQDSQMVLRDVSTALGKQITQQAIKPFSTYYKQ